jgi:hypothetical protein
MKSMTQKPPSSQSLVDGGAWTSITEGTNKKLLALNKFITAPDSPHELGWFHHNHFRQANIRNSVDLSWVCEYQRTRHSYVKQCLQSLRLYNKSFKVVGGGGKFFELVDMILYDDYDRVFYLEPKDSEEEANKKPSLDVGGMLTCLSSGILSCKLLASVDGEWK